MHVEPLIKKLKSGWTPRIMLYILTNVILSIIIRIWTLELYQIILLIPFMIIYIIAYENLGIMYDRLKNKK